MTDTKTTLDEQIAWLSRFVGNAPQGCNVYAAHTILAALEDYKRIHEAEMPEPVAWMITGDGVFGVKDGIVEMHKEGLLYWEHRGYDTVPLYPESALLQAREEGRREGMREAATVEQLKQIEFASQGYCPACSGWEVTKGQGCQQKVHTKDCWINKAITRAAEGK